MSMLTKEMDHSLESKDPRMNLHIKKRKPVNSSRQLVLLELPAVATEPNVAHIKNMGPEPDNMKRDYLFPRKEVIPLADIVSANSLFHLRDSPMNSLPDNVAKLIVEYLDVL